MRERHSRTAASSAVSRLLGCITLGGAAWFLGRTVVRRMRRFDFQGTTVLITGGSRGLGLILARKLIEQNARVAICARDRSELDRARSELVSLGGQGVPDLMTQASHYSGVAGDRNALLTDRRRPGDNGSSASTFG